MSTWRRRRAHTNTRASSIAPPGEEGWTIRDHRAILTSEPYASADLGAASDADRQVFTVRGCAGLFAGCDLTPTPARRHRLRTARRRPLIGNIGSGGKLPGPSALRPGAGNDARPERPTSRLPGSAPGDPELPAGGTFNAGLWKYFPSAGGDGTEPSSNTDQVPFAKYARSYTAVNTRTAPAPTWAEVARAAHTAALGLKPRRSTLSSHSPVVPTFRGSAMALPMPHNVDGALVLREVVHC